MRTCRLLRLLSLSLLICMPTTTAASSRVELVDGIIVKYKESDRISTTSRQDTVLQQVRMLRHAKRRTGDNADIYYLDRPRSTAEARRIADELMRRDDVEYAEPDYRRYRAFIPNDTRYPEQWYLKPAATEPGAINAELAWNETRGDSSVVIAVVDTGILVHQDISSGRVLSGYDFISDSFSANDGNGRDADPTDPGDAVSANDCGADDPENDEPSSWHGTLVSGILIAQTGNLQGIAGVDHQASLLPLRALGKCGGSSSDIADAIRWAAGLPVPGAPSNENPADIINLSLGSQNPCSITEQLAIDAAVAAGAVVVASAGNDAMEGISAPASCNNVIAVAATSRQGSETCYTNVGANVDLSAPGGNDGADGCTGNDFILSTGNNGTTVAGGGIYEFVMGTSFAAPLVSGAAALMRAVDGSLTPTSIETILKNTARAFPTPNIHDGFGHCTTSRCGAGILDIFGAVTAAANGGLDSVPNPFGFEDRNNVEPGTPVVSGSATITGIDTPAPIRINRGEYSIDGGSYTDADGLISAGQKVRIRLTSSSGSSSSTSATLNIGGIRGSFTVTTRKKSRGGGEAGWLLPLLIAWRLNTNHRAHREHREKKI
jgi:serine protease